MCDQFRALLRRLRRDESGQSLIVIVSAMTVLLGVAGFAIDTANWMVRHHDAQVVADSAALAAAQCLATPGQASAISGTPLPKCSSSSDTADAQTVAVDYAAANGIKIAKSDVTFSGKVVTVNASTSTPSILARVMGIGTTTQSAQAGAGWTTGQDQCSSPGSSTCDFMFADDSTCSSQANGIQLFFSGNAGVNGNVQSNGNLSVSDQDHADSIDGGSFGPGSGCSYTPTGKKFDPWSTDPTQNSTVLPYPIDYSKDFPACGGTTGNPCSNGLTQGYPTWCTQASTYWTFGTANGGEPASGNIYCASGTGTKSDPSTWNGAITISGKPSSDATFVGGTIDYSGGGNGSLSACGYAVAGYAASTCSSSVPPQTPNYPVFYATCNSSTSPSCAVPTATSDGCPGSTVIEAGGNGTDSVAGDMFAAGGTMCIPSSNGNFSMTTMIEAQDIYATVGGNFTGDGPMASGTGTPASGSVTLVQ